MLIVFIPALIGTTALVENVHGSTQSAMICLQLGMNPSDFLRAPSPLHLGFGRGFDLLSKWNRNVKHVLQQIHVNTCTYMQHRCTFYECPKGITRLSLYVACIYSELTDLYIHTSIYVDVCACMLCIYQYSLVCASICTVGPCDMGTTTTSPKCCVSG
jgi:hypothetical protein